MNQMHPHALPDKTDQIYLGDLVRRLIAQWPIIVGCMILALVGGGLTLHYATYTYTAELKVTPTQSSSQNLPLQGLSGLASLAGVSLPRDLGSTQFVLYVEGVTSRSAADALAQNPQVMKIIFKSEWDARGNRFVERLGPFENWINSAKKMIGIPVYPWTPPDGARLREYLVDRIRVAEERVKPIVTLSYDHEDPVFAVAFLTTLNKTVDDQLRQRSLARVNENIAYLSRQLATITLTEHRSAITQALSEQEKTKMLASSSTAFAAEMIGVASASFRPTKPNPLVAIAVSVLGGFLLGVIIALWWEWLRAGGGKLRHLESRRNQVGILEGQSPKGIV